MLTSDTTRLCYGANCRNPQGGKVHRVPPELSMIKEEAHGKMAWETTHQYYGYDGGIANMRCVADNVLNGQTVPYESNQELLKPLAKQLAKAPADGRWPVLRQEDFVEPENKPPKFATRAPYHVLFPNQLQYVLQYNLAVGFALGYRAKELEGEPKKTEREQDSEAPSCKRRRYTDQERWELNQKERERELREQEAARRRSRDD